MGEMSMLWGRKKIITLAFASYFVTGILLLLVLLSGIVSLSAVAMLVLGVFIPIWPQLLAFLSDVFPPERYERESSKLWSAYGCGAMIGSVLAVLLLSVGALAIQFLLAAVLAFFAICLAARFLPDLSPAQGLREKPSCSALVPFIGCCHASGRGLHIYVVFGIATLFWTRFVIDATWGAWFSYFLFIYPDSSLAFTFLIGIVAWFYFALANLCVVKIGNTKGALLIFTTPFFTLLVAFCKNIPWQAFFVLIFLATLPMLGASCYTSQIFGSCPEPLRGLLTGIQRPADQAAGLCGAVVGGLLVTVLLSSKQLQMQMPGFPYLVITVLSFPSMVFYAINEKHNRSQLKSGAQS